VAEVWPWTKFRKNQWRNFRRKHRSVRFKDDMDLHTSGGSVKATNCTGKIKLSTSGGSLRLKISGVISGPQPVVAVLMEIGSMVNCPRIPPEKCWSAWDDMQSRCILRVAAILTSTWKNCVNM
jgi:hypothetical protein